MRTKLQFEHRTLREIDREWKIGVCDCSHSHTHTPNLSPLLLALPFMAPISIINVTIFRMFVCVCVSVLFSSCFGQVCFVQFDHNFIIYSRHRTHWILCLRCQHIHVLAHTIYEKILCFVFYGRKRKRKNWAKFSEFGKRFDCRDSSGTVYLLSGWHLHGFDYNWLHI